MNVLFIVPDFYPNSTGFANASYNLIKSIVHHSGGKYKIHVFTDVNLRDNNEVTECKVIRYKKKTVHNRYCRALIERKKAHFICDYVQKNDIDIIFFETNTFPFFQNLVLRKYKEKVFVRIHSTADTEVPIFARHRSLFSKIECRLMKKFIVECNNVVSTSDYYLDFIRKHYLCSNIYSIWNDKSYSLIYNTAGQIHPSIQNSRGNTFITMGKMSANGLTQKGIIDCIKAVYYLLSTEQLPDDFILIVIGDGIKYQYIVDYADRLGVRDKISFIKSANHQEVFSLIENSRAVILLSRYEGQSMFITESIALGKAIIASKNNGMEGMIQSGKNGFTVNAGDSKAAAEVINRIINMNDDELREMEAFSRKIYDKYYSEEATYLQFDSAITLRG